MIVPKAGFLYGGEWYEVDVPAGTEIASVTAGEPVVEKTEVAGGAETVTTTTPLTVAFQADPTYSPLTSALEKYEAEPKTTYAPSGRAGTRTDIQDLETAQAIRWENYTPQERAALESYLFQKDIEATTLLAVSVAAPLAFVAAPVTAGIGAVVGAGVQQGIKGVQGGGLLTPEELVISAGGGAVFSVAGGAVMGQVAKAVPTLVAPTIAGAASRITTSTGVGAAVGAGVGAGQAFIGGGDVAKSATEGAMLGGALGFAFGVGGEVVGAAKPWLGRQYSKVSNVLSPERAMYNRVVLGEAAKATPAGETMGDKLRGIVSPDEAAMYRRAVGQVPKATDTGAGQYTASMEAPKTSWTSKITNVIQPEKALYQRVTTPKVTTPTGSPSSGGAFIPYSGGKGGLMSVVVTKQAPAVKTAMKPMPVQLAAWEADLAKEAAPMRIEPLTVTAKPKTVAVSPILDVVKSAPAVKPQAKTNEQVLATSFATPKQDAIFDPTQWQGAPYLGTRRRGRSTAILDIDTTVLSYPDSGLGHPTKLAESVTRDLEAERTQGTQDLQAVTPSLSVPKLGTQGFEGLDIGLKSRDVLIPKTKDVLKPKTFFDTAATPILDTSAISSVFMETTTDLVTKQSTRSIQEQTSFTSLRSQFGRGRSGIPFDFQMPSGWGVSSPLRRRGVGRQKREYPILTGAQVLEDLLSKKKVTRSKGSRKK